MDSGEERLLSFWQAARRLAGAIILGGAAVCLVALPDGRAAALGWVLGGAVSVLRYTVYFRALGRMQSPGPLVRARLVMYAMSAAALAVAFASRGTVSLLATAAGLLAMNAAVFIAGILTGRRESEHSPSPADTPK
jgi:hypothetical protein